MPKRTINPLALLGIDNLLGGTYSDPDEDEDQPTNQSREVYTFIYRLLETWRYMPIATSDGGKIVGKYITESDNPKEIAQAIIQLLDLRFKVTDRDIDDPIFTLYKKKAATQKP